MAEQTIDTAAPAGDAGNPDSSLLAQLRMMTQALWFSPVRTRILILAGSAFAVIVATAYGQVRLNRWNQPVL